MCNENIYDIDFRKKLKLYEKVSLLLKLYNLNTKNTTDPKILGFKRQINEYIDIRKEISLGNFISK